MKKFTFIYYGLCVLCIISAISCSVADVNEPKGNTIAPKQVTVTRIENQNGQSIIYYNLPDDVNFKYIKAVYQPRSGVKSEVKASFFTDSLIVNGFVSEGDYPVELYSVSGGEACSEPVKITVSPLQPPYLLAANTAKMTADWGGIKFESNNPMEKKLIYFIEQKDTVSNGWNLLSQNVSADSEYSVTVRGLESKKSEFRYYIQDYWGNKSEPTEVELTPWFEEKCDKKPWKQVFPPDEFLIKGFSGSVVQNSWDDNNMQDNNKCWQNASKTYKFPIAWTIDLGDTYHLSRLEEWAQYYPDSNPTKRYEKYFNGTDLKDFELYGAETLDMENPLFDSEGNLNPNWTLLGKYTNTRPSGSLLTATEEAITELEEYHYVNRVPRSFDIPIDAPNVRYFKMRILTNWRNTQDIVCIAEISLYGQKVD